MRKFINSKFVYYWGWFIILIFHILLFGTFSWEGNSQNIIDLFMWGFIYFLLYMVMNIVFFIPILLVYSFLIFSSFTAIFIMPVFLVSEFFILVGGNGFNILSGYSFIDGLGLSLGMTILGILSLLGLIRVIGYKLE